MDGMTVVITGANSGLGKEASKDFAKRGARVVMACRNVKKAKEARGECSSHNRTTHMNFKGLTFTLRRNHRRDQKLKCRHPAA